MKRWFNYIRPYWIYFELCTVFILVDVAGEVKVDKILIATQFRGAVPTDLVVEGGGIGIVESVHGKVEHTIILILKLGGVLIQNLVGLRRFELCAFLGNEIRIVEVSTINAPKVKHHQAGQHTDNDA